MKLAYSVLMSVYHKEKVEYFHAAVNSIWNQTLITNNFVLVCDGPLNKKLDTLIEKLQAEHSEILHVVRLQTNCGLGNALNTGINYCRNELVARMDSDDISRPDRCEKQLAVFLEHPEVSICSGIVEEFTVSIERIESRRVLPERHEQIIDFAKKRNPFNHPCVMYKKSAVQAAGGYQDLYLLEDYYLWIRMIQKGFVGYNLQEPILWMRGGPDIYKRRAGWKYAMSQRTLFKYMKDRDFINSRQYLESIVLRSASSIAPNWLREFMFKAVMREK